MQVLPVHHQVIMAMCNNFARVPISFMCGEFWQSSKVFPTLQHHQFWQSSDKCPNSCCEEFCLQVHTYANILWFERNFGNHCKCYRFATWYCRNFGTLRLKLSQFPWWGCGQVPYQLSITYQQGEVGTGYWWIAVLAPNLLSAILCSASQYTTHQL